MTRVALLVVHTNTYFSNLLPIARLLARSGAYEPQFLFANAYPMLPRDEAICLAEGFMFEIAASRSPPSWPVRVARYRLRNNPVYTLGKLATTIRALRRSLQRKNVGLMILPADNRYDLAAYVKAAHEEGIPAVVVPAFMAAADEWAQFVAGDPDHDAERLANRVTATVYPRWAHTYQDKPLLAQPASEVVARQLLGIAPPSPWTLHSGHADAIAVESEAMRQYCLVEGVPARQLVLTGSMDHDRMHERANEADALREALYRRLGMPAGRPMLLTALPPDQLYGRGRPQCDFQDYGGLVRFWLQSLAAGDTFNVVISLHPSVKRETMAYVEDWGAKIVGDNVSTVIPLCEAYVASVSATIQWAIACGKPVLNYDVYRYRYPDYVGVRGVLNVEEQGAFVGCVKRLCDPQYREELRAKQAQDAKYWGVLDGKAGERLLELFSELAQERPSRAHPP